MQQCGSVQFKVSDFGFEMQDLSNFKFPHSSGYYFTYAFATG